jgi:hypothetical protein
MPTRMSLAAALLNRIIDFYLNSSDFNGIRANAILGDSEPDALETLKKLVGRGVVEVYSSEYDNPHIKRLPALSVPQQLGFLDAASSEEHVCLFPSIKTMRRRLPSNKYRTKPFSRFLALGHPQLEPVFFQLGVLERYQSDPRYIFRFDGLDGHISVKTANYKGKEMAEADKVGLETFGLGTSPKGHRVIVTFPRYLASMSSRHQQHWDTYRVHGKSKMEKNYALRGIWGQWTDGVSIYDALLAEIFHINQMCQLIGLPNLFRRDYSRETRGDEDGSPLDEPKGFGLLMVPTKKHFLEFAQILDKVISENLNTDFFAAQHLELEEKTKKESGEVVVVLKGTLRMLEEWLTKYIRIKGENGPAIVIAPLKEVRKLRQSPAHKFVDDEFSIKYQERKEDLIAEVYRSVSNIRMFFQTHPKAQGYQFPDHLKPEHLVLF